MIKAHCPRAIARVCQHEEKVLHLAYFVVVAYGHHGLVLNGIAGLLALMVAYAILKGDTE